MPISKRMFILSVLASAAAVVAVVLWRLSDSSSLPLNRADTVPAESQPRANSIAKNPFVGEVAQDRSIRLDAPVGWQAKELCLAHLYGLVSGTCRQSISLVPLEGKWALQEDASWPRDSGMLLIVEYLIPGSTPESMPRFFECFLVNFKMTRNPAFKLTPPASVVDLTVTAIDSESSRNIDAELTLFGSRRAACSHQAALLLAAKAARDVQSIISTIEVTMLSNTPAVRISEGKSPLMIRGIELGSTGFVRGTADGYESGSMEFTAARGAVSLTLKATTSLLVTVTDPADTPARLEEIFSVGLSYVNAGETTQARCIKRSRREVLFERLVPGAVMVAASSGDRVATRELTISPGFNLLQLELPSVRSSPVFKVAFVDQDGNPIDGLRISAQSVATAQGQPLRMTRGVSESWSAALLPPVRLFVSDPWGRVADRMDPDGIILTKAENVVTLRVQASDVTRFAAVILETDSKLAREVIVSHWPQCESLVDADRAPLFHAGSQAIAVPRSGLIELSAVPYGILMARAIGLNGELAPAASIEISDKAALTPGNVIRVRLPDPASQGVDKIVKLVDAGTNEPLPEGVVLMLDDIAYSPSLMTLGKGGVLILKGMTAGRFRLSFVKEDYSPEDGSEHFVFDSTAGTQELAFRARKGGRVAAVLVFADNDVSWIQAEPMDRELSLKPVKFEVDAAGLVKISGIRPGTYQIGVARRDEQPVPTSLKLYLPAGDSRFTIRTRDSKWDVRKN